MDNEHVLLANHCFRQSDKVVQNYVCKGVVEWKKTTEWSLHYAAKVTPG